MYGCLIISGLCNLLCSELFFMRNKNTFVYSLAWWCLMCPQPLKGSFVLSFLFHLRSVSLPLYIFSTLLAYITNMRI